MLSHRAVSKLCLLPGWGWGPLQCSQARGYQEMFGCVTLHILARKPKLLSVPRNIKAEQRPKNNNNKKNLFGFCFSALSLVLRTGSLSYVSITKISQTSCSFTHALETCQSLWVLLHRLFTCLVWDPGAPWEPLGKRDTAPALDHRVLALNCHLINGTVTWHEAGVSS